MALHDLLLLKRRIDEVRCYKLAPDGGGCGDLTEQAAHFLKESGRLVIGLLPVCGPQKFMFSDMAIDEPGDQPVLARKWGLKLPQDYSLFCSSYAQYLFAGRISYHLWDAAGIEEQTLSLRQGWDISESAPHRLFPFAKPVGEPAYFAFRWSPDFSRTDVVYCWDYGDVGETHLLGAEGERFVSDCDFTSWLARMMQTDGSPVFPGSEFPTSFGSTEENLPPLVRVW